MPLCLTPLANKKLLSAGIFLKSQVSEILSGNILNSNLFPICEEIRFAVSLRCHNRNRKYHCNIEDINSHEVTIIKYRPNIVQNSS